MLGSGNISISTSLPATGSSTTPIYINSSGSPTVCSYSLGSLASHAYQTSYSSVTSTSHSVVIKEYVSGTSGYRIWSTGYCEQWGIASVSSITLNLSVSFTKTFKSTPRVITTVSSTSSYASQSGTSNYDGVTVRTGSVNRVSTTNFYISRISPSSNAGLGDVYWLACGYLASGQY